MRNRYIDGIKKNKLNFVTRYPRSFFLVFVLILLQFLFGVSTTLEFGLSDLLAMGEVRWPFYALEVLLFFFLVYNLKRLHLVLVAAEFQNMFYSNATKALTEFYFIVTDDGEVVYQDERVKEKDLRSIFGEKYKQILSEIKEGVLYHCFQSEGQVIEIIPMIRPKGYLLMAARKIGEEKFYDILLKEAGISLYSVKNRSFEEKGSSYMDEIGGKDFFLEKKLYELGEVSTSKKCQAGLLLRNYRYSTGNAHYGILVPKLKEVKELADNAAIGIAFMSSDLEIITANEAFCEVFEKEEQIWKFFRDKVGNINPGDAPSIVNLSPEGGDSMRIYLSDYGGLIAAFLVDLSELSDLQRKFQHSQKIVSLGELSGGIAHDFNNILTAILGFAEILLEDVRLESKHYYNIAQIRYSAKKGRDLVKKILAFSRKQTLHPEILNITDIVKNMRQFIERLVPENIKLTFVLKSRLKNVKVDKTQIEQSLVNLIVNARDAIANSGEITVEVEELLVNKKRVVLVGTQNEEIILKGEYVILMVKDNGSGMSSEIVSKIFDPFFSTKSVDKGTGLGLSTVYGIIKQMKGYINVDTSEGNGSIFTLFIPVSYESVDENLKKVPIDLLPSEKSKGAKILLVEDDRIVRNFLLKALNKHSFDVIECASSRSALENFKKIADSIELVVTDVVMPCMDGPEMAKEMRKSREDLKVLFISGYTRDKLHLKSGNCNEDFISKPFGISELISKIVKLIEN